MRGNYTSEEKQEILSHCWTDVRSGEVVSGDAAVHERIPGMQHGSYTRVVAAAEFNGIPIYVPVHEDLKAKWPEIKVGLAMSARKSTGTASTHWTPRGALIGG